MARTHRTHEEATVEMFRKDPELAADYLNSVLEDGDETDLMLALRTLSKAFGGVQEVARQADVNAHTLYRTLSEKGNPELKTLSAILKAMGMRLAIQPLNHHAQDNRTNIRGHPLAGRCQASKRIHGGASRRF